MKYVIVYPYPLTTAIILMFVNLLFITVSKFWMEICQDFSPMSLMGSIMLSDVSNRLEEDQLFQCPSLDHLLQLLMMPSD